MTAPLILHRSRRKAAKLWRHFYWSTRPRGALPLFWHVGQPNFGDDFNPVLFDRIFAHSVRLGRRDQPHFLGAGSILHQATRHSVVLGSGLISDSVAVPEACGKVVAVRGERSLQRLKPAGDVGLGDPFVLMARYFRQQAQASPKTTELGFIPHISYFRDRRKFGTITGSARIIDLGAGHQAVIEQISRCRVVISESLHGLIVSDALGIPNIWARPSGSVIGGEFKFGDYYSTMDQAKSSIELDPQVFAHPERFDPFVSNYRYDLGEYERLLRAAAASLPPAGST